MPHGDAAAPLSARGAWPWSAPSSDLGDGASVPHIVCVAAVPFTGLFVHAVQFVQSPLPVLPSRTLWSRDSAARGGARRAGSTRPIRRMMRPSVGGPTKWRCRGVFLSTCTGTRP
eukprot:gene23629-biopygen8881